MLPRREEDLEAWTELLLSFIDYPWDLNSPPASGGDPRLYLLRVLGALGSPCLLEDSYRRQSLQ